MVNTFDDQFLVAIGYLLKLLCQGNLDNDNLTYLMSCLDSLACFLVTYN